MRSLRSIIEETLTLFYEKARKRNLVILTEFETGLDFIEADKQRMKQILINLLSNAVKFSKEEGGTITITAKKAGDNAQISVSDTGIGIKPENLRVREHDDQERSFYSKKTVDLEYDFPFGTKELYGLAYRTNYDLSQHQKFSGVDLTYQKEDGTKITPHFTE